MASMDGGSTTETVTVGGMAVDVDDAFAIIVGYCLGAEPLRWSAPSTGIGDDLGPLIRGAFAYRTYDCIVGGPTHRLEPIDVLVADGLNARLLARHVAGVLAVADQVSAQLERIDQTTSCFWDLSKEKLATPLMTEDGNAAWPIWRAWTILMGVDGIDIARAHKILHHKRPNAFPLLDNKTITRLPANRAWAAIHDDLHATPKAWSDLERKVTQRLALDGDPPLTRLRLHDILLWTDVTGKRQSAMRLGGRFSSEPCSSRKMGTHSAVVDHTGRASNTKTQTGRYRMVSRLTSFPRTK